MQVKFLTKEKDFVEAQLEGFDEGLAHFIVEKLLKRRSVSFAAATVAHPLIPTPVVHVRASDARKELLEAVEEVEGEIKQTQKAVEKIT